MRNRQTRIIIGILVGLVLFASSIALLMYSKQSTLSEYVEGHIEVYVAARHLYKGDKISSEDITKAFLPKSYLAFTPLTQSEIIGRYAQVEIFKKEPLRKEKIASQRPVEKIITTVVKKKKEAPKELMVKYDTLTIPLTLFQNIDSSLKRGDRIDIISVIPRSSKSRSNTNDYSTKYIALNVKVNTFISNYKSVKKYLSNGSNGMLQADSIVFEMSPDEIKNFLSVYYKTQELNAKRVFNNKSNRGHIWMVKCSNQANKNSDNVKKRMLVDHKQTVYRKKKAAKRVSISYED